MDFVYIAGLEGDQWLRGYVPFKKGGLVAGRSGMTIASGFDLGQWSQDEMKKMELPQAVLDQIVPYAANNFQGLTKMQVVKRVGKIGPVPTLEGHKNWADLCDAAVFKVWLGRAQRRWDEDALPGVPRFTALPGGWQTVWLSRRYQAQSGSFERLAAAGKWEPAVAALRAEPNYKSRTDSEANLLQAELPPPVVGTPHAGKQSIPGKK